MIDCITENTIHKKANLLTPSPPSQYKYRHSYMVCMEDSENIRHTHA
nr:MAG TPA: hypothetical protein [Caudoviricetes sp.]